MDAVCDPAVRRAKYSDLGAIADLFGREGKTRLDSTKLAELMASKWEFLVLDSNVGDGKKVCLAAAIGLATNDEIGTLGPIAVAARFRAQTERLIAVAELLCQSRGCTQMVWRLGDELTMPRLYRKLGYQIQREATGFLLHKRVAVAE